jgi:H+/Cl- antiporter ClcA
MSARLPLGITMAAVTALICFGILTLWVPKLQVWHTVLVDYPVQRPQLARFWFALCGVLIGLAHATTTSGPAARQISQDVPSRSHFDGNTRQIHGRGEPRVGRAVNNSDTG